MQITVTDHNDWEGEDFSFVMEVSDEMAHKIKMLQDHSLEVQLNTRHTKESVDVMNKLSNNGYMNRIGFYDFKHEHVNFDNVYEDIFYKAGGLKEVQS